MNFFLSLKLVWLSPESIRKISFGEITNHGMVDSRAFKPKIGGLFDPKIFGMSQNWEFFSGKYTGKKIRNKNVVKIK